MQNERRIPDLYQLLALQPLEDDRAKIEQALRKVHAQSKAAEASNPQQAAKAARIVALGKHYLLSDRKTQYDQQWKNVRGRKLTTSPLSSDFLSWDFRELNEHLPTGDPKEPFDLPRFLRIAAEYPPEDYQTEFERLSELLKQGPVAEVQPDENLAAPESRNVPTESVVAKPIVQPQRTRPRKGAKGVAATSLAKQIRRKRERSMLLTAVGILATLAVVLGMAFFALNRGGDADKNALANKKNAPGSGTGQPSTDRGPALPALGVRGSGLPKVQGLDGADPMQSAPQVQAPVDFENLPDASIDNSSPGVMQPTTTPAAEVPMTDSVPPTSADTAMQQAMASEATTMAESPLTTEEKEAWLALLTDAKALIGQQQYDSAAKKLEQAQAIAKNQLQREQLERLATIYRLAKDFQQSMVAAIANLSAGETFTVGSSTQASFVEGSVTRVVVRIRGQNQAFELTEMPVGLAFGLVALKTDITHPTSLAQQAAFTLVHPGAAGNDLALARSKSMMSEAIAAGAAAEDMLSVFSDDYRL